MRMPIIPDWALVLRKPSSRHNDLAILVFSIDEINCWSGMDLHSGLVDARVAASRDAFDFSPFRPQLGPPTISGSVTQNCPDLTLIFFDFVK